MRFANITAVLALAAVTGPVVAANLLTNADFDTDLAGWTVDATGTGAAAIADNAFGKPAPGSAYLALPNPGSTVDLWQCVALAAPLDVDLIANAYTDGSSGTSTNAVLIESYDAADCTGTLLDTQATDSVVYEVWGTRWLDGYALPAKTASVRVVLALDSGDSSEYVHFDHVILVPERIFADGYEP
jgi:hypothetical protein